MVRISYKDGQNWTNINGEVQNWTDYREFYKGQRVQPNYLAPEITTDTWNGKIIDVQHVTWEAYFIEFFIKESEVHEVNRLKSCSSIIVNDLTNNLTHVVDMQTADFLEFNDPERVADTSNWKVSFVYRTNKTTINKGALSPLQTNTLVTAFDDGSTVTNGTFYTDYDLISVQEDSDLSQFSNESGTNTTSKAISKQSNQIVFYNLSTDANTLKKEFERAQTITLNGATVLENRIVEYTPIGEGLVKLVVSCSIETIVNYPLNV